MQTKTACEECGYVIEDGDSVTRLNRGDWNESEGGYFDHGYPRDFCSRGCLIDYLGIA